LWHIIVIGLIAALYFGYISIPTLTPPSGPGPSPQPQPSEPTDGVSVTKQLKISFIDKYAGSAPSGTGGYIYDETGKTQLEGGTSVISSGIWTTTLSYSSGTVLWLKYVYDTTNDDIFWTKITVPKMSKADAEALTTNPITVYVFNLPTLTDALRDSSGNSYSDNGNWNKTSGASPGANVVTATYSWYVGSDNDGYISSHDPIYDIDLKPVLYVTVSGTNYENVLLSGFDGAFEKGTTMYYYHILDDTEITKYKVGNEYVYSGAGSFTWTVDVTGYSGDAADMQIYLYVYSDPEYLKAYGSYGPYAVQLAEQTINLVD